MTAETSAPLAGGLSTRRRTLAAAAAAHAVHDGCTDLIYVLLPLWQAEFALGYGALAALRGLYAGMTAGAQWPASRLAERWGVRTVLVLGTLMVAAGYALAGCSTGLIGLVGALLVAGLGASTQHPLASAAVARAFGGGNGARGPLGTYNFSGDIGKAAIPAAVGLALSLLAWRPVLAALAVLVGVAALVIGALLPTVAGAPTVKARPTGDTGQGGFGLLLAIGILDSGVRMGLLTFLPFLLSGKGADQSLIGVGLALVFLGGAAGKLACGWFAGRLGIIGTVVATEAATAILILALLGAPLPAALILAPILGIALNGTSSVLYGSVAQLAPPGRTERAFAWFYSATIGSGAATPVLFGLLGDHLGVSGATIATALAALLTLPFALLLAPRFRQA
jgi:MFS family permease